MREVPFWPTVSFLFAFASLALALIALSQLSRVKWELEELRRRLGRAPGPAERPTTAPVIPSAPALVPTSVTSPPPRQTPPPLAQPAFQPVVRDVTEGFSDRLRDLGLLPPADIKGEYALGAWFAARIGAVVGSAAVIFLGIWLNLRNELPAWVRLSELVALSGALIVGGARLGRTRSDLGRVLGAVGLAGVQFAAWGASNLSGLKVIQDPLLGWAVSLGATAARVGVALRRDSLPLARITAVLGAVHLFLALGVIRGSTPTLVLLLLAVVLLGALPLALRGWVTPAALSLVGALIPVAAMLERSGREGVGDLQLPIALALTLPFILAARWSRRGAASEDRASVALELGAFLSSLVFLQLKFHGGPEQLGLVDGAAALLALVLGWLSRRRGERLAEGCFLSLAVAAAALGIVQYTDDAWTALVWLLGSAVCLVGAVRLELAPLRWTSDVLAVVAAVAFCVDRPEGVAWLCAVPLLHGLLLGLREKLGFLSHWLPSAVAVVAMAAVICWSGGGLAREWHSLGWLLPLALAWLAGSPRLLIAVAPFVVLDAYPSAILGLPWSDQPRPSVGLLATECALFLVVIAVAIRARLVGLRGILREVALAFAMLALLPLLVSLPLYLAKFASLPLPRSSAWVLGTALLLALLELGRRWAVGPRLDILAVGFAVPWVVLLDKASGDASEGWQVALLLLTGLALLLLGLHRARPSVAWGAVAFAVVGILSGLPHLEGAGGSLFIGLMAVTIFVAGHLAGSRGERIVGLACLGLASFRVVFHDLSDTFGRIVACAVLAAAFFGVAWLYARWSRPRDGQA